MKKKQKIHTLDVREPLQRKALASPMRIEVLGQFQGRTPMTVADIAIRLGRPPTAVYYHVHRLEEVGLLVKAGKRPGPKRDETLYQPVADQFDLTPERGDDDQVQDAISSFAAAQRMATADLKAALETHEARFEGKDRNLIAFRLHTRLDKKRLARANKLLDELFEIFQADPGSSKDDNSEFFSLTLALAPLRGRDWEGKS